MTLEFEYVTPSHNLKEVRDRRVTEAQPHDTGLLWEPVDVKDMGEQYGLGGTGQQIGEILRKETHQCAFCRGSGSKPRGSTCPVCRGKGLVQVTPPAMI